MAIPPDPIGEVLAKATLVVDAEVLEVLASGATPPKPGGAPEGATSVGVKVASQRVRLKIRRVMWSRDAAAPGELVVEKPAAGYALRAGNHGPFLIDQTAPIPQILGRYGPDSYALSVIETALQAKRG